MGDDVMIRVEGLSKSYRIHHDAPERYTALRDVIARGVGDLFRSRPAGARAYDEEFWALKDVSFEVKRGEVVGVIGRNGAGKSTLLKILSRITEPTTGRIELNGRVSSLLEVGTGFHPELTGRENVFLNGSILGMSRREVTRKFDEIVAFAEVERFLDTPVKRYSSGMYMRLAFAVAAHMEPEILIVDEVLAVGDNDFQKKCLGKMEEVAGQGRTVIFVSHNMGAIEALCEHAIQLEAGRLAASGPARAISAAYIESRSKNNLNAVFEPRAIEPGFCISNFNITPPKPLSREGVEINFCLTCEKNVNIRELQVLIYSFSGQRLCVCDVKQFTEMPRKLESGTYFARAIIKEVPFVEGTYSVGVYIQTDIFDGDLLDIIDLEVLPSAPIQGFVPSELRYRGVVAIASDMSISPEGTVQNTTTRGQRYA